MKEKDKAHQFIDPDHVPEIESKELYQNKASMFSELWDWVASNVDRTNTLKGWKQRERRDPEFIALMHSELSECLEYLRHGNPHSDHVKEISGAEEELADVIIRMMDMAITRGWNIPRALFLKMEYNKSRPYRHGGKRF